jgi:hypothetical protein
MQWRGHDVGDLDLRANALSLVTDERTGFGDAPFH